MRSIMVAGQGTSAATQRAKAGSRASAISTINPRRVAPLWGRLSQDSGVKGSLFFSYRRRRPARLAKKLGPTARPKAVFLVPDLPKTRSGKIMRRLLRDVADGHELGDTTTLADPSVVSAIAEGAKDSDED